MKRAARASTTVDARLLGWAALLVLSAGSFFVWRAGEDRLAARVAGNAELAARLRDERSALRNEPLLRAAWRRIAGRAPRRTGDVGGAVARFLAELARVASRHHTVFTTIAAGTAAPFATRGTPRSDVDPQPDPAIPFDLTLEGRYPDVLATIRELSTMRVPARIERVSIARKYLDAPDATLTVSLHAALVPVVSRAATAPMRAVALRRDPFDGLPGIASPQPAAAESATIPAGPMPLPPDGNALDTAFPIAADTHEAALVTGSHAFALVYGNGSSRMVTIGDRVNGARIRAIRDDGLLLEDGTRVPVAGRAPSRSRLPARLRRAGPSR